MAPSEPYVISNLPPQTTYRSDENTELERGISASLSFDAVSLPANQGADTEGVVVLNSANNAELIRQDQAATKAQAAVRGYLVICFCLHIRACACVIHNVLHFILENSLLRK